MTRLKGSYLSCVKKIKILTTLSPWNDHLWPGVTHTLVALGGMSAAVGTLKMLTACCVNTNITVGINKQILE